MPSMEFRFLVNFDDKMADMHASDHVFLKRSSRDNLLPIFRQNPSIISIYSKKNEIMNMFKIAYFWRHCGSKSKWALCPGQWSFVQEFWNDLVFFWRHCGPKSKWALCPGQWSFVQEFWNDLVFFWSTAVQNQNGLLCPGQWSFVKNFGMIWSSFEGTAVQNQNGALCPGQWSFV